MSDSPSNPPARIHVDLFDLGRIVATRGASDACPTEYLLTCLCRHMRGDWGFVCAEDQKSNFNAVKSGGRILSSYPNTLWIITEGDRSATTFLLPSEY